MRVRASITVYSALAFWLITSFLFALLEAGRVYCLNAFTDMSASTALESVCAEYQPGLWEEYHLLGLDGAYGGSEFSIDYVTAVFRERMNKNLNGEHAGGGLNGLSLSSVSPAGYRLLTDADGAVFLACISDYMKSNLPMEAAQALYENYTGNAALEEEGKLKGSVEDAQNALDEAKRLQEAAAEGAEQAVPGEGGADSDANAAQTADRTGDAGAGNPGTAQLQGAAGAAEPVENPLETALAWKRNTFAGLVLEDVSSLSTKSIRSEDSVGTRNCQRGTIQGQPEVSWYDKILALEYAGIYFADYQAPATEHALSYELEYLLCGKQSDRENLEGALQRLLLFREAANVTHILSDSGKWNETLAVANALAGFTGNPGIIQLVQIGVIAAWAYVESILDIRALLAGDKIALVKRGEQWTSSLGNLSGVFGKEHRAKDCGDGLSYQGYLKGFLFLLDERRLSVRMMDLIEKNLRLAPASRNFRADHIVCEVSYDMEVSADPLFWRFVSVVAPAMNEHGFSCSKQFSYYR